MTAAVRTLAVAHGWREVAARRAQVTPPCDWCGVPSVLCAGPTRGACIDHAPSLARAVMTSVRRGLRHS